LAVFAVDGALFLPSAISAMRAIDLIFLAQQ